MVEVSGTPQLNREINQSRGDGYTCNKVRKLCRHALVGAIMRDYTRKHKQSHAAIRENFHLGLFIYLTLWSCNKVRKLCRHALVGAIMRNYTRKHKQNHAAIREDFHLGLFIYSTLCGHVCVESYKRPLFYCSSSKLARFYFSHLSYVIP